MTKLEDLTILYLQKVKCRKMFLKNQFCVSILKINDENSRIWIQDLDPDPNPLVRGMGPQIRIRILLLLLVVQ